MMDLDVKNSSKRFTEMLRERIAELENLEAAGLATADTCEMLVDLHEMLNRLDELLLRRASRTLH